MIQAWPTFHDLMTAYKSCRLHKPASLTQIAFEKRLGQNLCSLLEEINSGQYHPAPAKCFIVTHPKPREIFAAHFRDRIVHHMVVSQLEPTWEKKFIYSNFACRPGKGSHGAIDYAQSKVRKLSQGGNQPVWALQLDIAKFFVTINRKILCQLLVQHCHHSKLRELVQRIYRHDARQGAIRAGNLSHFSLIPSGKSWFDQRPEQGIAIGNLTSQFGANVYLTALDHFIQRNLKPKAYLRYMDDLLMFDHDPQPLLALIDPIDQWLKSNRDQCLNPDKTRLTRLSEGIGYLGYQLRQVDSSSEPLQVFSEPIKKWRWIKALHQLESTPFREANRPHFLAPFLPDHSLVNQLTSLNSQLGSFHHCKSYLFRKQSLEQFLRNTTTPQGVPTDFTDPWCPFKLKKGYRAIRLR